MTLLLWPAQCLALVAWPNKVFLRSPQVLDSLCKRCSHSVLLGRSARANHAWSCLDLDHRKCLTRSTRGAPTRSCLGALPEPITPGLAWTLCQSQSRLVLLGLGSPQVLDSLYKRCSHSVLLGRSSRANHAWSCLGALPEPLTLRHWWWSPKSRCRWWSLRSRVSCARGSAGLSRFGALGLSAAGGGALGRGAGGCGDPPASAVRRLPRFVFALGRHCLCENERGSAFFFFFVLEATSGRP